MINRKWIEDYPEARSEYDQYSNVVDLLINKKLMIDTANNITIKKLNELCDQTGIEAGEYFDLFEKRATEWFNEAQRIHNEISNFISELNKRITTATSKRDIWRNRIGVGHWEEYDDGK